MKKVHFQLLAHLTNWIPREATTSKIQTAEQIAEKYSWIISTFCQNIPAGAKENIWGKISLKTFAHLVTNLHKLIERGYHL